ncbi:MAG TPA: LPXTG cell wall anchor domain-containing protein, partial [Clostridia bacterium]|nr:LPXTG cell wall anchor domain-containing protein [Clostridia bacterium]
TISIDYLPEGDYILKETRSLRGYIPCEEQKINFENYGVNSPLLIELVNKRELPKTGEKSSHGLVFLSIALAAAGFLIQKRFN